MKHHYKHHFLPSLDSTRKYRSAFFIAGFAAIGIITLLLTRAATPTATFEAESGTRTAAATLGSDALASSGSYVKFGSGSTGGGGTGSWWKPGTESIPWQWMIAGPFNTSNAGHLGTNSLLYNGQPAPPPLMYDIDLFENSAATVAALKARNGGTTKVICYFEVGADDGRSDSAQLKSAWGATMDGYASEHYIDIRKPEVMTVMKARIDQCAQKGFDGVEPDIDDAYAFPEDSELNYTRADEVNYLKQLAAYAHSKGLAWGLKNGGDSDDSAQFVSEMLPYVDFALVEAAYGLNTYGPYIPEFYNAGKALFIAENNSNEQDSGGVSQATFNGFCTRATTGALAAHANTVFLAIDYDGSMRRSCN